jgi:uncharacterized protein YggT (Ycf19 family)
VLTLWKIAVGSVLVILSLLGFGLTWTLYSVLNSWNNDPYMHNIGYGLYWLLPLLSAIFCLMFLLIGIYLLNDSAKKNEIGMNSD